MHPADVPSSPLFDRDARSYDDLRRRLVPCFDALYGTVLDLVAEWHPSGSLGVLDLGAGTGLLSAMILDRHPDARLRLVDASGAMLEEARRRLFGQGDVGFVEADMGTADLGGPWGPHRLGARDPSSRRRGKAAPVCLHPRRARARRPLRQRRAGPRPDAGGRGAPGAPVAGGRPGRVLVARDKQDETAATGDVPFGASMMVGAGRIALAGFGDFEVARTAHPRLTTVSIASFGIGHHSGSLLLRAITAQREGRSVPAETLLTPFHIVPRETT